MVSQETQVVGHLRNQGYSEKDILDACEDKELNLNPLLIKEALQTYKRGFLQEHINELIKKSFGKTFAGNYKEKIIDKSIVDGPTCIYEKQDKLEFITKRFIFRSLVGKINERGSAMILFKGYEKKAERYAQHYEAKYGIKPKITFKNSFMISDNPDTI